MHSILQWNIRNFKSQKPHLQHAIDIIKPSILCLQETHLKSEHNINISSFPELYRKDRIDRAGGGVLVAVRKDIASELINIDSELEVVAVKIFFNNKTLTICSLYLPPDLQNDNLHMKLHELKQLLPKPFVICIDANAHHPVWGSSTEDKRGKIIVNFIEDNDLILLNTGEPTYLSNYGTFTHIDITVSSADISTHFGWQPHNDTFNSDHFPILIKADFSHHTSPLPPRWKLSKADWKAFMENLKLPNKYLSPTQACGSVTTAILDAANKTIPKTSNETIKKSAYWWTHEVAKAHRNKKKALTKYKNHLGNLQYWIDYKKCRATFRHAVLEAQKKSWHKFLSNFTSNTNSSQVWKQVKILTKGPTTKNIAIKDNNQLLTDPLDVANKFAAHFASKSSGKNDDDIFMNYKRKCETVVLHFESDNSLWYNKPFTESELNTAIKNSSSSTPGPDTIPNSFFKHFNVNNLKVLLSFYNYIFENGFPHQWRESYIIPILKPLKPPSEASSYRPIALTNCMAKIMEKMINRRLQYFLEHQNYYSSHQSGFRATHSTTDAIIRLEYSASYALLTGQYCVAVFLDIAGAFDSVWHYGLLRKLKDMNLRDIYLNSLRTF